MFFLPIMALTTVATTKLFITGVSLGTTTYIGVKRTQKK